MIAEIMNQKRAHTKRKLRMNRRSYRHMRKLFDAKAPRTFLELLESGKELDCDLIVGDADMPASFVWDTGSRITRYGIEKYRLLMDAPVRQLPNGNIELLCDAWQLGEDFGMAAAGYIAEAEYQRLFDTNGGTG